jgi:hypothetical protein
MAAGSRSREAEVPKIDQFTYLKEPFFVHLFVSQMMVLDREGVTENTSSIRGFELRQLIQEMLSWFTRIIEMTLVMWAPNVWRLGD